MAVNLKNESIKNKIRKGKRHDGQNLEETRSRLPRFLSLWCHTECGYFSSIKLWQYVLSFYQESSLEIQCRGVLFVCLFFRGWLCSYHVQPAPKKSPWGCKESDTTLDWATILHNNVGTFCLICNKIPNRQKQSRLLANLCCLYINLGLVGTSLKSKYLDPSQGPVLQSFLRIMVSTCCANKNFFLHTMEICTSPPLKKKKKLTSVLIFHGVNILWFNFALLIGF